MLSELLQGIETGGILIIRDSCSYSGRDLLKSFIIAALNRYVCEHGCLSFVSVLLCYGLATVQNVPASRPMTAGERYQSTVTLQGEAGIKEEVVHVLCFDVSEEELRDRLKPLDTQRLYIHNAYSDPLGWTGHPAFTVQQFSLEDLTGLIKQTSQPKAALLVIDSLSWILRHMTPPTVCRTLQQLRKGGAVRAVIGLLHTDMHQRGTVGSVCHLATSLISVAPGVKGNEAVAKITKRSKSGKVLQDEEIFCITEDLTVTILSKPSHPEPKQNNTEEEQADPTANLTFNLRLSDSELEAKQKLALPFVFSKEKKTALLHPGPGTGRILYEPDANDDYDQEDPDDDLDV